VENFDGSEFILVLDQKIAKYIQEGNLPHVVSKAFDSYIDMLRD
jgi:hypothetical protein